jgi:hypothetical protein
VHLYVLLLLLLLLAGILADEMGLGKTVELLALIAGHRLPQIKQEQHTAAGAGNVGFAAADTGYADGLGVGRNGGSSSCCSRCGEHLEGPCYNEDGIMPEKRQQQQRRGWQRQQYAAGSDSDYTGGSGQDADRDVYVSARDTRQAGRKSKRKQQKQQQQRGRPKRQQQQHGAGHHGAKRQKGNSAKKQQQQQWQRAAEEAEEEEQDPDTAEAAAEEKQVMPEQQQGQQQQQQQNDEGGSGDLQPLVLSWGSRRTCSSRVRRTTLAWGSQQLQAAEERQGVKPQQVQELQLRQQQEQQDDVAKQQPGDGDDVMEVEQQQQQQQGCSSSEQAEEEQQEETRVEAVGKQRGNGSAGRGCSTGSDAAAAAKAAKAAAAAETAAAGSSGVLCGCCLREMALQEVSGECGTTLIVVPSNILVQVSWGGAQGMGRQSAVSHWLTSHKCQHACLTC